MSALNTPALRAGEAARTRRNPITSISVCIATYRRPDRLDVLLADLVKIFLPRLTPEHVFEWYMPVPPR